MKDRSDPITAAGSASSSNDGGSPAVPDVEAILAGAGTAPSIGRHGVYLKAGAALGGSAAIERLRRFSPVLVIFPEPTSASDPTPHPRGHSDFHPRSVDTFLTGASFLPRRLPQYYRRLYILVLVGLLLTQLGSIGPSLDACNGQDGLAAGACLFSYPWFILVLAIFFVLFVDFVGLNVVTDQVLSRNPSDLRATLEGSIDQGAGRDGLWTLGGGISSSEISPGDAWKAYGELIKAKAHEVRRTAYVRTLPSSGSAGTVIQYWFFYYFNDWWNRHEADWECVSLFFPEGCETDLEPVAAAYSCHEGSVWRTWSLVDKVRLPGESTEDPPTHPKAFVARGSHAMYFAPSLLGFRPWTSRRLGVPIAGRLLVGFDSQLLTGSSRDVVPAEPAKCDEALGAAETYELRVIPRQLAAIHPGLPNGLWEDWWWLRFRGTWGKGARLRNRPPTGPPEQRSWKEPYTWVLGSGESDTRWEDMFADAST